MDLQNFLTRFQGVSGAGTKYMARCPAHEDKRSSLSIALGRDGGIVLHCHVGCATESILERVGLAMRDLMPPKAGGKARAGAKRALPAQDPKPTPVRPDQEFRAGGQYFNKKDNRQETISCVYEYRDEDGTALVKVARTPEKSFPVCHLGADGQWYWGRGPYASLLYRLPELLAAVRAGKPVYVVEGEKDVESMAAMGYVATCNLGGGGKGKWPEGVSGYFAGADVCVIPDNDQPGRSHAEEVCRDLIRTAKRVRLLDLALGPVKLPAKGDATDFFRLVGKKSTAKAAFDELAENAQEWTDGAKPGAQARGDLIGEAEKLFEKVAGFRVKNGCLCQETQDGETMLCSFVAAPVEEITRDDGVNADLWFRVRGWARDGTRLPDLELSAEEYQAMNWPIKKWGANGNVRPGSTTKGKVLWAMTEASQRNAIRRTEYSHSGWRKIEGKWAYLYQGGAIGAENVAVALPNMERYGLSGAPDMAVGDALALDQAMMAVLPERIGVPIMGLVYLTPLCEFLWQRGIMPKFAPFLLGRTGSGKSTVAALALSHFGQFTLDAFPASFNDTANAIRDSMFVLKDCLLVVDDYHPPANQIEKRRMEEAAQAIARGVGDRQGRNRLSKDLRKSAATPPRGMVMVTGEDLPAIGESGIARFYVIPVSRGDIQLDNALSTLTMEAAKGTFQRAMAGYVEWLIRRSDGLADELERRFYDFRETMGESLPGTHNRVVDAAAHLLLGYEMMLKFWLDVGFADVDEFRRLMAEARLALVANCSEQARDAAEEKPAAVFIRTIQQLLATKTYGIKKLGDPNADNPENMIGYVDQEYYYLTPDIAYAAVSKTCQIKGTLFQATQKMLYKYLREEKLIAPQDDGNATRAIRVDGRLIRCLWIPRRVIDGDPEQRPQEPEQTCMG